MKALVEAAASADLSGGRHAEAVEQADEDVGRGPGGPLHKTGLVFALRDNQCDVIVLFARAKPLHLVEHGIEQRAWG